MGEPEFAKINQGDCTVYIYVLALLYIFIYSRVLLNSNSFILSLNPIYIEFNRAHFILFNTIVSLDNLYSKFFLNNIS